MRKEASRSRFEVAWFQALGLMFGVQGPGFTVVVWGLQVSKDDAASARRYCLGSRLQALMRRVQFKKDARE